MRTMAPSRCGARLFRGADGARPPGGFGLRGDVRISNVAMDILLAVTGVGAPQAFHGKPGPDHVGITENGAVVGGGAARAEGMGSWRKASPAAMERSAVVWISLRMTFHSAGGSSSQP